MNHVNTFCPRCRRTTKCRCPKPHGMPEMKLCASCARVSEPAPTQPASVWNVATPAVTESKVTVAARLDDGSHLDVDELVKQFGSLKALREKMREVALDLSYSEQTRISMIVDLYHKGVQ